MCIILLHFLWTVQSLIEHNRFEFYFKNDNINNQKQQNHVLAFVIITNIWEHLKLYSIIKLFINECDKEGYMSSEVCL